MQTVAAVYTAPAIVESITELFNSRFPGHRLINLVDGGLIQDIIRDGGVTVSTSKRLLHCFMAAVDSGAKVIFNTCSSVGDVVEHAQQFISIPIVKIDTPMALAAVRQGSTIAVLATLPTTLGPTVRQVERVAAQERKEIVIVEGLADGAFQALTTGDPETHDSLILETAKKAAGKADVIVLAQGSMARMKDELTTATGVPVFASPVSGVDGLAPYLE